MVFEVKLKKLQKNGLLKVGRNDPCPCGSGIKYKKCCLGKEQDPLGNRLKEVYFKKHRIRFKKQVDIEGITKAGLVALATLDLAEKKLRPGMSTDEINALVHEFTLNAGATSAPLNYRGFPKSVCISVNEEICHGIPGERVLKEGDIANVDITPILNGYYADASKTFFVGTPGSKCPEDCEGSPGESSPRDETGPTRKYHWRHRMGYSEICRGGGCSVVREFVGHGVGVEFHEPPQIPHYGQKGQGITLIPGMVFTIEPMINLGKKELRILDDGWTAVTVDGSLSAQFEQTILVTEDGFESLTPYDL